MSREPDSNTKKNLKQKRERLAEIYSAEEGWNVHISSADEWFEESQRWGFVVMINAPFEGELREYADKE